MENIKKLKKDNLQIIIATAIIFGTALLMPILMKLFDVSRESAALCMAPLVLLPLLWLIFKSAHYAVIFTQYFTGFEFSLPIFMLFLVGIFTVPITLPIAIIFNCYRIWQMKRSVADPVAAHS